METILWNDWSGDLLILHIDGVKGLFDMNDITGFLSQDAESITAGIMHKYCIKNDDASCIAIKYQK